MERIEYPHARIFRAQGIVGADRCNLTCIASFPAAASVQTACIGCKKKSFFLPVGVLSGCFRNLFLIYLRKAFQAGRLKFQGEMAALASPAAFEALCRQARRVKWVVFVKPPFGGPEQVLKYLARYTHRVAISNRRLLSMEDGRVAFEYKDYADGNQTKVMTLEATEFLRRFAQHILPRGFVRIRQFGFLANTRRSTLLALARQLLTTTPKPPAACLTATTKRSTWQCPHCNGEMRIGPNLSARQLAARCRPLDSS